MSLAEGEARVTWKEALPEGLTVGRLCPLTTSYLTLSLIWRNKARGNVIVSLPKKRENHGRVPQLTWPRQLEAWNVHSVLCWEELWHLDFDFIVGQLAHSQKSRAHPIPHPPGIGGGHRKTGKAGPITSRKR